MSYANSKTKTVKLNTFKNDMIVASENSENLALDFPYVFGFISLRHADLFNLMRQLPGNSFKLYLYFFSQQEGARWQIHRARVCKDTGLTEQEYRTAMAKLVEVGVVDFDCATLNGIMPLTKQEIFDIINEENQEYIPEVNKDLKDNLDKHADVKRNYTDETWTEKAKNMDVLDEDKTFNTKKEALKYRDSVIEAFYAQHNRCWNQHSNN